MQPIFISVTETASVLGLGRTKIYQLLNSGDLSSTRIGGRRLVEFASAERFARESLADLMAGEKQCFGL
ncbi:excise, DNA binding domain, excisionase family [Sphingomonadaceae bacterium]